MGDGFFIYSRTSGWLVTDDAVESDSEEARIRRREPPSEFDAAEESSPFPKGERTMELEGAKRHAAPVKGALARGSRSKGNSRISGESKSGRHRSTRSGAADG